MTLYDRFRWAVLNTFASYHIVICAVRMGCGADAKGWVHDRPDWFIKFVALHEAKADFPEFERLKRQAVVELSFRRTMGVSR